MDPLTHLLAGTALGLNVNKENTSFNKTLLYISLISSVIPDLDVILKFFLSNKIDSIFLHRHFTHSIIWAPVNALISIIPFIRCLYQSNLLLYGFYVSVCSVIIHIILDVLTSYGTVILWPISEKRFAYDILTIINFPFTLFLFLFCLFSYYGNTFYKKASFILLFLWLMIEIIFQLKAYNLQFMLIRYRNHEKLVSHRRVIPALGQIMTWHSIYVLKNKIYCDKITFDFLGNSNIMTGEYIEKFNLENINEYNIDNKLKIYLNKFVWFADGFVCYYKKNDNEFVLGDLRYSKQAGKIKPYWGLKVNNNNIEFVKLDNFL